MKDLLFTVLFSLLALTLLAQPSNDECTGATQLTNLNEFCSDVGAYTTITATPSPDSANTLCFPNGNTANDVWFYFVAQANTLNVNVIGNTGLNSGGSLTEPQLIIYSGDCLNGLVEEECFSDAFNNNFAETFASDLIPGEIYYIRISNRSNIGGTFQLCVSNFNKPPEPEGDCPTGVILCDKSFFSIDFVLGGGNNINEILDAPCAQSTCGPITESSSSWYKFTCDQAGSLTFSLTPNNPDDDLDFLVYELPNGINDCSGKIPIRCMLSGQEVGADPSVWLPCTGATGLLNGDQDDGEACGCDPGNNNFVAPIQMESGKSYALIVNNFSNSSSGFAVSWGGTGTFLGPNVDFVVPNTLECDEPAVIVDASSFAAGNIVSWAWFFGEGAQPANHFTPNPPLITYESFGEKFITLTIESDGGCFLTKTIPITVNECCMDAVEVELVDILPPLCANTETASIEVEGSAGNPEYLYSLDNAQPLPYPFFNNLGAGGYQISIQDIKGCTDFIDVIVDDPPVVLVDAGQDITVNLGEPADLFAAAQPLPDIVSYEWNDSTNLSCIDCPDPSTISPGSQVYSVTVTNSNGCTNEDRVTVFVQEDRPIYIPNAFTPNGDGQNDRFYIFGNDAAETVTQLQVYNRWGALVYEARELPLGLNSRAWDGTFKGKVVNPGVYVYYATIRFIDNRSILYEGDVTIIR